MVNNGLSSKKSSASSVMQVMARVAAELERGRGVEAVRLFGNALDHGVASPGTDLIRWLIKTIGKQNSSKLVIAYAHHPCFYCKKGLDPSEACVTTGGARCDFCDGSGLVTYDAMPPSLRLPAAIERVRLAAKALEAILRRPAPRPSQRQPHECLKTCAQRLTDVNRLMGVFENALVLARALGQSQPRSRPVLAKILRTCIRYAPEGRRRIRDILHCMVTCARYEAQDTSLTPAERNSTKRRAVLLEALLKPSSTFAGTALEHPFLYQRCEEFTRGAMGSGKPHRKPARNRPVQSANPAKKNRISRR